MLGTNLYQLWYNGAQVGTTQTIADAAIIGATLHGYFNTYSGNTVSDFACSVSSAFQPLDLAPALWLKADAITGLNDADAVTTWVDASVNGRDATQSTAGAKPTYKTGILNSKPVVRFDGGDWFPLPDAAVTGTESLSVFIVAKATANNNVSIVFAHAHSQLRVWYFCRSVE